MGAVFCFFFLIYVWKGKETQNKHLFSFTNGNWIVMISVQWHHVTWKIPDTTFYLSSIVRHETETVSEMDFYFFSCPTPNNPWSISLCFSKCHPQHLCTQTSMHRRRALLSCVQPFDHAKGIVQICRHDDGVVCMRREVILAQSRCLLLPLRVESTYLQHIRLKTTRRTSRAPGISVCQSIRPPKRVLEILSSEM